jgi:hypothetical protein
MKRSAIMALAFTAALAAPGYGQTAGGSVQGQAQSSGQAELQAPPAEAAAQAQAQAQARAETQLEARQTLEAIKAKGAKVSAAARSKAEAKLAAVAKKTNEEASAKGDATVAGRLAAEFGMTAEQLMAEHQSVGCSWGELMIAHSLQANSTTEVTAAQLLELHQEGTGWGQIAAGLGFKLGEVVSAVQAEGRVAAGLAKPDGKVAVIHGPGARAGVGAQAGANAGVQAAGTQAAARAGVGVGVKIKP